MKLADFKTKVLEHNCAEVKLVYKPGYKLEDINITRPSDVHKVFLEIWDKEYLTYRECSYILMLSRGNKILGWSKIGEGGRNNVLIDLVIVLQTAILTNANGIIFAHNHPSGSLNPSDADNKLTKKLKAAFNSIGIDFVDHMIITEHGYYSYLSEGNIL